MPELAKRQKIAIENPSLEPSKEFNDRYIRRSGKWSSSLTVNWYFDMLPTMDPQWQASVAILRRDGKHTLVNGWNRQEIKIAATILHVALVGVGLEDTAETISGSFALHAFKSLNLKEVRILREILAVRRTDES